MDQALKQNHINDLSIKEMFTFLGHFISKVVLYAIFIMLILISALFLLYFADLIYYQHNNINKPALFNSYVIVSPSMVPTIMVQDAIIVHRVESPTLRNGDIITFSSTDPRYEGMTITHRIVGIQKAQNKTYLFRTKGDANNVEDPALVQSNNIFGKVILKIPKLGYLKQALSNYVGILFFIIVPSLTIMVYDISRLIKLIRNKNNKEDSHKTDLEDELEDLYDDEIEIL